VEVLLDANEVGIRLQSRLRVIAKVKADQTQIKGKQNLTPTIPKENGILEEHVGIKVNLPKLQLPTFDGKVSEWQEFWDIFASAIHDQNLPVVSKFAYLRSVLRGMALSAIAGVPVTSDTYPLVIKLLRDRYGKKEAIIELIYSRLQNMPRSGSNLSQIKSTCDNIEKLLRQLEAQGEEVSTQRNLIQQIISKFPVEVITKFEETKGDPSTPWTMGSLRSALSYYVMLHENVQRYANNNNVQVKGQNYGTKHGKQQTGEFQGFRTTSTEVLTASSQKGEGKPRKASLPCIFCRGSHFNDMCDMYSSLSERKQNLSQQHRCFVCLKVGHFLKNCPSLEKKSCCYCGKRGAHNRCLCPHRFKKQDSDTFVVTEPTKFIGSGTTDGSRNTAVNTTHTDLTNCS